ncbi:unnamed protein product [Arabidopsis halleri]
MIPINPATVGIDLVSLVQSVLSFSFMASLANLIGYPTHLHLFAKSVCITKAMESPTDHRSYPNHQYFFRLAIV